LSKRQLSTAEVSLLSKGLKFVPTPKFVNRAVLKEELEIFGHKLLNITKYKFNPKGKDAAI